MWQNYQTDLLQDPVVPPITGQQFLKLAVVAGIVLYLARKAFRG